MSKAMAIMFLVAATSALAADMTDFDGDGLPDVWEAAFGLSTNKATGIDGPYGDPDCDGLSNYAEYMAGVYSIGGNTYSNSPFAVPGLSPTNAYSLGQSFPDSYLRPSSTNSCLRFLFTDADFCDDSWELANPSFASVDLYDDQRASSGMTAWSRCRSDGVYGRSNIVASIYYNGNVARASSVPATIRFFASPAMIGSPSATARVYPSPDWSTPVSALVSNWVSGIVRPGTNYVFAFIDLDDSGDWSEGEPAGISSPYEVVAGFDAASFSVGMTDDPVAGIRASFGASAESYRRLRVYRRLVDDISPTYSTIVDDFVVSPARNYVTEADWIGRSKWGLDWGLVGVPVGISRRAVVYDVYLGNDPTLTNNVHLSTFTNTFTASSASPSIVAPVGSTINSRNVDLSWAMDVPVSNVAYSVFLAEVYSGSSSGPVACTNLGKCVARDIDATYHMAMPFALTNGLYVWRVGAANPKFSAVSSWSGWGSFTVADRFFTPTNQGVVNCSVFYSGAQPSGSIIVEAHRSSSFVDAPVSRVRFTPSAAVTNMSAGESCQLSLLPSGEYYLLAWRDSNGDGARGPDDPWGYANWFGSARVLPFKPRSVRVQAVGKAPSASIVIEDVPGLSRR